MVPNDNLGQMSRIDLVGVCGWKWGKCEWQGRLDNVSNYCSPFFQQLKYVHFLKSDWFLVFLLCYFLKYSYFEKNYRTV